jgi:hypothetical protein
MKHRQKSKEYVGVQHMKSKILTGIALFLAALVFISPVYARNTVYVTADNLAGTNLFGTLNLETGEFTQIAQTTPLFYALSAGPEGRIYGADLNTGTIFTISDRGVTKPYGTITAPGYQFSGYGFFGLAYQSWEDKFFAVNVDPMHVSLYRIGSHGRTQTDIGVIEGPNTGIFFSGSLAIGPHGKFYYNFVPSSGPQLYVIDQFTGAPTPIGSGLGTDVLALFSDGSKLFGIDTDTNSEIGIYVIDIETGVATPTGVTVKGLPATNDFYIDTAMILPAGRHERCE